MAQQPTHDAPLSNTLRFLWGGLPLALLVGISLAAGVYFLTSRLPPRYHAEATVFAADAAAGLQPFGLRATSTLDVPIYEVAAYSDAVVAAAAATTGSESASQAELDRLRGQYDVASTEAKTSSLLTIVFSAATPETAALGANAVAESLIAWDANRAGRSWAKVIATLESEIEAFNAQLRLLSQAPDDTAREEYDGMTALRAQRITQLTSAQALATSAVGSLELLQPAVPPRAPYFPRPLPSAAAGLALGLLLAYGAQLLGKSFDTRLRTPDDVAQAAGLPVIAAFPRRSRNASRLHQESASYLRTSLLSSAASAHPKIILVSSARAGEGKPGVAARLAESFVRNRSRTLLVDADLRRPGLADVYDITGQQQASLIDYLENPQDERRATEVTLGPSETLHLIPTFEAGPHTAELLGRGFATCLEVWARDYEVIVVNVAPVLEVADALSIAPLCTGTVLVTRLGHSRWESTRAAVDAFRRVNVPVFGVVATNVASGAWARRGGRGPGAGKAVKEQLSP